MTLLWVKALSNSRGFLKLCFNICSKSVIKDRNIEPPKDAKTRLQERAHIKGLGAPVYRLVSREGSEHEPVFHIGVALNGMPEQVGTGKNKKLAEFDAAAKMLEQIGE